MTVVVPRVGSLGRQVLRGLAATFLIAIFWLAGGPAFSAEEVDTIYRLGSGDKVRVTVFGQADMSGEFSVTGSGEISLPFVGKLKAGGLTVTELELSIADVLQPDYLKNPRVSVEVLNFRPFDIIGEVSRPGSYPYRSGMTILNAVAMAGGFTYRAKQSEFYIKRATNTANVKEDAGPGTLVLPGDLIEVRERFF